jgi:hypothetical protein
MCASKILFLFFLLHSVAFAGVPQAASTVGMGGGSSTGANSYPSTMFTNELNSNGFFSLYAHNAGGTPGNVSPFYKNGVIYQVPGTAITCSRVKVWGDTAGNRAQLLHATSTFAINATTASLSGGAVYQGGISTGYIYNTVAANSWNYFDDFYTFPANSWPGFQMGDVTMRIILSGCR